PAFPGKKMLPRANVSSPSAALGGPHDKRRSPQIPSPSGLVPLPRFPHSHSHDDDDSLLTYKGTFLLGVDTLLPSDCTNRRVAVC
ncbi:MAG: hypothetical protein OXB98_15785, partial [Bryobacterales bacterium]|nr:hypothetical protein [Bryobacterales bacterium]